MWLLNFVFSSACWFIPCGFITWWGNALLNGGDDPSARAWFTVTLVFGAVTATAVAVFTRD